MRKFLTHNFILKIISLGLAIVTWIYVNGEVNTEDHPRGRSHISIGR